MTSSEGWEQERHVEVLYQGAGVVRNVPGSKNTPRLAVSPILWHNPQEVPGFQIAIASAVADWNKVRTSSHSGHQKIIGGYA